MRPVPGLRRVGVHKSVKIVEALANADSVQAFRGFAARRSTGAEDSTQACLRVPVYDRVYPRLRRDLRKSA